MDKKWSMHLCTDIWFHVIIQLGHITDAYTGHDYFFKFKFKLWGKIQIKTALANISDQVQLWWFPVYLMSQCLFYRHGPWVGKKMVWNMAWKVLDICIFVKVKHFNSNSSDCNARLLTGCHYQKWCHASVLLIHDTVPVLMQLTAGSSWNSGGIQTNNS